jgi:hypothetical protein
MGYDSGSRVYGNTPTGSIKGEELLDQLSNYNYYLLKKDRSPCS